jgi:hypothetical protein
MYKVIRHYAKIKISLYSDEYKKQRRALLDTENEGGLELSHEYKQIVIKQTQME